MSRCVLTTPLLVLASIMFLHQLIPTYSKSMRKYNRNISPDVQELLEIYRDPCPELFQYRLAGNNPKGIISVLRQPEKDPNILELNMMGVTFKEQPEPENVKFRLRFMGGDGMRLYWEATLPPQYEHWVLLSILVNDKIVCKSGIQHADLDIERMYFHYSGRAEKDESKRRRGSKTKKKQKKKRASDDEYDYK